MVPLHSPEPGLNAAASTLSYATAGQRTAENALNDAVRECRPLILLFGETGVGKTTLIRSFLPTIEGPDTITIYLSATSGDFIGQPTFESFLEAICRRIGNHPADDQRPALLAALASAVDALAGMGRKIVLAIDHADYLTNALISDLTKLPEYLDAAPASLTRIFVGSPDLASRLDVALRRPGAVARLFAEIRLSRPSVEEAATLLAYEDTAQPGGPMLTPGAIDRISIYSKSNLHWAVPLADAARALAMHQGEREVTPELVGGALLELWPPGPQAGLATDLSQASTNAPHGMSDVTLANFSAARASAEDLASVATSSSSPAAEPGNAFAPTDKVHSTGKRPGLLGWLWIALAASALAALILVFLSYEKGVSPLQVQPDASVERNPAADPEPQQPREQAPKVSGEGDGTVPDLATEDAKSPPVEEPANTAAEQKLPGAPLRPLSEPRSPSVSSPSAPATKAAAPSQKTAPKPKTAPTPRAVKKPDEGQPDQWIQTR